ncbi:DOPA 4,5-dioxygenase family protein [Phenylobacterium sp.]|uniref:DOPA 4,5-dioxygenase family protein n=1 Tax=Phenylobacterium sp. TaxID=1871053 RepID=UPI0025FF34BF|nr:DOPA 4,5-dioxygenase family protein [Phenylobacterium sp.]
MTSDGTAPYHAHIYHEAHQRSASDALHMRLTEMLESGEAPDLLMVGELREGPIGPHPLPQFEIHFLARALPTILPLIEASGLRALVHPLTDDDLADHTSLAKWIGGGPLDLDLSVMDPPGENKGLPRFGKIDF